MEGMEMESRVMGEEMRVEGEGEDLKLWKITCWDFLDASSRPLKKHQIATSWMHRRSLAARSGDEEIEREAGGRCNAMSSA